MSFKCPECKEVHGRLLKGHDGRCFWCLLREDKENRKEREKVLDKTAREVRKIRTKDVGSL